MREHAGEEWLDVIAEEEARHFQGQLACPVLFETLSEAIYRRTAYVHTVVSFDTAVSIEGVMSYSETVSK